MIPLSFLVLKGETRIVLESQRKAVSGQYELIAAVRYYREFPSVICVDIGYQYGPNIHFVQADGGGGGSGGRVAGFLAEYLVLGLAERTP